MAEEDIRMKKTIGIAVMNFFGISAIIAMLDMFVARFNINLFVKTFTRPSHLAFVAVFGLIMAVAAFVRPGRHHTAAAA